MGRSDMGTVGYETVEYGAVGYVTMEGIWECRRVRPLVKVTSSVCVTSLAGVTSSLEDIS